MTTRDETNRQRNCLTHPYLFEKWLVAEQTKRIAWREGICGEWKKVFGGEHGWTKTGQPVLPDWAQYLVLESARERKRIARDAKNIDDSEGTRQRFNRAIDGEPDDDLEI